MLDPVSSEAHGWTSLLHTLPPRFISTLQRSTRHRRRTRDVGSSAQDADVFQAAEEANTSTAAYARLAIAALIAALLFGFASRRLDSFNLAAAVVLSNLALSVVGVLLVRWRRMRRALPFLLALVDVVFILSIVTSYPHSSSSLPALFRPALIATWGIFLALALSTVRGTPGILALQTVLFAGGYLAISLANSAPSADPQFGHATDLLFGNGYNAMRAVMILLTGSVLVVATLRARTNLRHAIAGSRRAASLARYLAPAIAEIVADTEVAALRRGRQQDMAVLFADVRGFTAMAETLTPLEIADFINQFRACATRAIEGSGGVIDKFIGDEVMGLFGLPLASPADAGNAVAAGCALLRALDAWNQDRKAADLPAVEVGIGIHYGPVFTGVLGDERLEFTVLGDTVNVARRLEQAAKEAGYDLVASSQVLDAIGTEPRARRDWTALASQPIRGHREPIAIFAHTRERRRPAENPRG